MEFSCQAGLCLLCDIQVGIYNYSYSSIYREREGYEGRRMEVNRNDVKEDRMRQGGQK